MKTTAKPLLAPVILENAHARLEPLREAHTDDLARATDDPLVWRFLGYSTFTPRGALEDLLARNLADSAAGSALSFAIIDRASGRAVGSTTYFDASAQHRHLEIGRTFLGRLWWRTALNTSCKRLLLAHAFEALGCHRVQLKTDARNVRSQEAIARLGAAREGILRAHMVMADGYLRDTVMFSVIAPEWPDVKARLDAMLSLR